MTTTTDRPREELGTEGVVLDSLDIYRKNLNTTETCPIFFETFKELSQYTTEVESRDSRARKDRIEKQGIHCIATSVANKVENSERYRS